MSCDYLTAQYIVFGNLPRQLLPRSSIIDFVDSLAALGIAQASLALLSFAKEFFHPNNSSLRVSDLKVIITLHFSLITLH